MSAIQYQKNEDNIVILTFDSPNQSANTMNADFRTALDEVVTQLQADKDIAGIIFRSAKKTFFAGGDLDELIQGGGAHVVHDLINMIVDGQVQPAFVAKYAFAVGPGACDVRIRAKRLQVSIEPGNGVTVIERMPETAVGVAQQ